MGCKACAKAAARYRAAKFDTYRKARNIRSTTENITVEDKAKIIKIRKINKEIIKKNLEKKKKLVSDKLESQGITDPTPVQIKQTADEIERLRREKLKRKKNKALAKAKAKAIEKAKAKALDKAKSKVIRK